MDAVDERRAYILHIRSEHRRLHEIVREIQTDLAGLQERSFEASEFDTLKRKLQQLQGELSHHFTEEEQGGCIEEAVSRCPQLLTDAREVERQHPELLEQLKALLETCANREFTALKQGFDEFAKHLLSHEALENRIIERGFNVSLDYETE